MKKNNQKLITVGMVLLVSLMTACRKPATQTPDTSSPNSSAASDSAKDTTSETDSGAHSSSDEEVNESAYEMKDFFPDTDDKLYEYTGEGVEYAGFNEYTDYSTDTRKQYRRPNEGTTVAEVVELQKDQIVILFHEGEIYYRENLLEKSDKIKEILLQAPFEVGHSWKIPDGRTKTITGLDVAVSTPYGEFDTLEVTTEFENGLATETNYYAPGIGLVKSLYVDKGDDDQGEFQVLTELKSVQETPYEHTIRFFYPDFENDRMVYADKDVPMKTNEETKKALEKAYKEVPDDLAPVLSKNAKIKSLYLNEDGHVYVDFTKELIDDMNAGSGLEVQIIDSLVNTIGHYYGVQEIYLTVEGKPYESGHISKAKGEFWKVNTESIPEFGQ